MTDSMDTTAASEWAPAPERAQPERLDRSEHGGTLTEAEHLGRYGWVAGLAGGRRILDAGCGTAYGTALLGRAGGSEVIGIDRARDVVEDARGRMPGNVSLRVADLESLPFDDGSFDLIACFEVIEHLADPEAGIDELARVLAPGGVLALSSPNRGVYPEGNPHHIHEYTATELRESLARRFANVSLGRQHGWFASAILPDSAQGSVEDDGFDAWVRKIVAVDPGAETFTLALAGNEALPAIGATVVLGPEIDQRGLNAHAEAEAARSARLVVLEDEIKRRYEELEQTRSLLTQAEQRLAELPALRGAQQELIGIKGSLSWRLTAPLRRAKAPVAETAPSFRRFLKRVLGRAVEQLRG